MRKFPYFPLIICQQVKGTASVKNLGVENTCDGTMGNYDINFDQ
jgi:hypothetical protein